jgi:hypothetical protein
MEFVDGEPIDLYCSRHRLSVRDRLPSSAWNAAPGKELRDKGAGLGADLVKPDALAREIAKCDRALADAGAF